MSIFFKLLTVSLLFCHVTSAQGEVNVAGTTGAIMHQSDLSTHINIDTLGMKHLYGLGPVSGLLGEIVVLDGKVYSTSLDNGKPVNGSKRLASMFVYSTVSRWDGFLLPDTISSLSTLSNIIQEIAASIGYTHTDVFPFLIRAKATAIYHIMDWKSGFLHTPENHRKFAYNDSVKNQPVTLLGFYSDHHKGVFTHQKSNMHIHILTSGHIVGHLDKIYSLTDITLSLPQMTRQ